MNAHQSLTFYVVDEDPEIGASIKSLLEEDGHSVTVSNDSNRALTEIPEAKPDCVIMDLMMPGIDGLGMLETLKPDLSLEKTKFLVVSSKAYEWDRRAAFERGADGYFVKPLDEDALTACIERIFNDTIDMTYWGVRGTLPVSGGKSFNYGGNTSCVTMEFPKGQFFIFDAGTGIKSLSDYLMRTRRAPLNAKIFISHPHWDHINALPFFTPLYMQGNEFEILGARHGNTTMREIVSAQMDGVYFPITLKEFAARVYFRNLEEETIDVDGIEIATKLLSHPGKCLGYRVNYNKRSICYVTDNEMFIEGSEFHNPHYERRLAEFCKGADILITDTTYTDNEYKSKVGWGHSCISKVVELAHRAEVESLHLFHHDPDQSDDDIDKKHETASQMLAEMGSNVKCLAPTEGATFTL
ncbi:MAG: response regulator [Rhodospirillales bacterium]